MSKLIESETTETLPSGMTITTLHLTPEAKRGLLTNGATIPPQPGESRKLTIRELTVYDHQRRFQLGYAALLAGTSVAGILVMLGVPVSFCVMSPLVAFSIPALLWAWRDLRDIKRRRLARQAESAQTEMFP